MDKKIAKDSTVNGVVGVLDATGLLGAILLIGMPVLAVIGLRKRVRRNLK